MTEEITEINYDSGAAEHSLRELRTYEAEIEEINAHATAERDRVDQWQESQTKIIENKMSWHKQSLEAYATKSDRKTIKLINGTVKRIAARLSIDIVDEEAIPANFMRRTEKIAPDKKRILDHVKTTGEIIHGVELNEGEVSWSITTTKNNPMNEQLLYNIHHKGQNT